MQQLPNHWELECSHPILSCSPESLHTSALTVPLLWGLSWPPVGHLYACLLGSQLRDMHTAPVLQPAQLWTSSDWGNGERRGDRRVQKSWDQVGPVLRWKRLTLTNLGRDSLYWGSLELRNPGGGKCLWRICGGYFLHTVGIPCLHQGKAFPFPWV